MPIPHMITGEEIIGHQGQCLTPVELRVLVGLANGETPSTISRAAGQPRDVLPLIESNIQRKLGAASKAHMIARGFILGVLQSSAIDGTLAA